MDVQIQLLRKQIAAAESHLHSLNNELRQLEQRAESVRRNAQDQPRSPISNERGSGSPAKYQAGLEPVALTTNPAVNDSNIRWALLQKEYKMYGRQLIMPEVGLQGQLRLKRGKVLVVGLGGLGSPAAAYLAGAGIGTIGLMDGDTVELSNLHRQIAHSTLSIGMRKVDSAHIYLNSLNPSVQYHKYCFHLTPETAISIFENYDLILDCTDHPTSRYLISDACVLTGKPLVSASALRADGQLIVLNYPPRPPGDSLGGPCYRCIFPKPPPAESMISCGEGGILGPVVGAMGCMQALEAIKVLTSKDQTLTGNSTGEQAPKPSMLMFSAYNNPQFRTIRLRARRSNCATCSSKASIFKESLTNGSFDYVAFCGAITPIDILPPQLRIASSDFAKIPRGDRKTLIDTRDETQYAICALTDSLNVPWTGNADTWLDKARLAGVVLEDDEPKFVVCRFGNDSQLAAKAMMDRASKSIHVKDIRGGLEAWRKEVDPDWPDY